MKDKGKILDRFFENPNLLFDSYEDEWPKLISELIEIPIIDYLHKAAQIEIPILAPKQIPQFSNLDDCTTNLADVLRLSGNMGPNFETLGEYLLPSSPSAGSRIKYGENQAKTGELLCLCEIKRVGENKVYLSTIGSIFNNLSENFRIRLLTRLLIRTDVFIYLYQLAFENTIDIKTELQTVLMETTAQRRTPNVKRFLLRVIENDEINLDFFRISMGL